MGALSIMYTRSARRLAFEPSTTPHWVAARGSGRRSCADPLGGGGGGRMAARTAGADDKGWYANGPEWDEHCAEPAVH